MLLSGEHAASMDVTNANASMRVLEASGRIIVFSCWRELYYLKLYYLAALSEIIGLLSLF
jgi:hypothetical protein